MKLIVIGSSSAGNCYILENETEALIIECGVRFPFIKQALKFKLTKVRCCLITHEHKDHCMSVNELILGGINIMATAGTIKAMGVSPAHHRVKAIEEGKQYEVGGFTILPFKVEHDAAQPVGFIINHVETGNVLFVTDTYYVAYKFRDLHNIIVEANFSEEIVNQRVVDGKEPEFLRDRNYTSHMSIANCKKMLQANDLSQVNNIVLIHLSDRNSNAEQFKTEISAATGKRVQIAEPGMIIENFNKQPF